MYVNGLAVNKDKCYTISFFLRNRRQAGYNHVSNSFLKLANSVKLGVVVESRLNFIKDVSCVFDRAFIIFFDFVLLSYKYVLTIMHIIDSILYRLVLTL